MAKRAGLLLMLCCLLFSFFPPPLLSKQAIPVFILHSYSQEYPWTKRQHEGFIRKLDSFAQEAFNIAVEYLDTKRIGYTEAHATLIADYIAQKYKGFVPKIIYVTDDNALLFALSHLVRIFPETPVFFSGINDFLIKTQLPRERVTGVFERKEIAPNLALMRCIAHEVRDILLVGDTSETFLAIKREIETELERHPEIHARFLSHNRIELLVESLRGRSERFVFLTTLGTMKDATGRMLSLREIMSAIRQAGEFIIFSMEDVYLYPGVVGGFVTSGHRQGEAAAEMVVRYLSGSAIADIAPLESSPNEYIFDGRELDRTGLNLPYDIARTATIQNPVPSFYERNLTTIVRAFYVVTLLFVLLLCVSLFIMRRKRLQIAESEKRYRVMFSDSPDAYLIIADGAIVDCNRAAEVMLRANREWIIGRFPGTLSPEFQPDGRLSVQAAEERIAIALKTGCQTFEWLHCRLDESVFWVEVSLSAMTLQGRPVLFTSWRDITERKSAEEQIRQLRKAESLARMAGAVAHHYNNLLSAIIGNLEMAFEDLPEDYPSAGSMARAMSAARRASELGGLMLAYLGLTIVRREPLSLVEVCRRKLSSLQVDMPEEITLKVNMSSPELIVNANAGQVDQILSSLVVNARESMAGRGGVITIALRTVFPAEIPAARRYPVEFEPGKNRYACLEVMDEGSGITEANMEKLFDPFYSTKFTGRGLGLPVVLGAIKVHDGCITVTSAPGKGSVFRVYLPLTDQTHLHQLPSTE